MPGTRITDEDRKKIGQKFICTICNLLLAMPMQTHCGHLMCFACLQTLLESSNPRCPEDGEVLKKDHEFHDAFTKRELNGLSLNCFNTGCCWRGTYDKLEGHSQVCEHAQINCVHSQCKMKFQRSHLGEHLKNECEYRNVKCNYCGKDVAFASIKDHVGTSCEGAPVTCKYCKEKILRKDIERHERLVCDSVPGECEFQAVGCNHDKTLKRKELRQHMNDGLINHLRLMLLYVLNVFSRLSGYISRPEFTGLVQKIRNEVNVVRFASTQNSVMLTGLERRIEGLESSASGGGDTRMKSELERTNLESQRGPRAQQTVHSYGTSASGGGDTRMKSELERTNLESQRGPCAQQTVHSYGTLLWKIDGYQRKRHDAINGVNTALCSPPFYSAQFGSKMCAKIYLDGNDPGKGTHLSLFFVVMRGDYDALLTWPFQKKITMMLLDQGNGDHMIDAFHSDQSSSFQRPKSDMNIAAGSPLFMRLDSLNNRQYIKDDVMFIKIIVD